MENIPEQQDQDIGKSLWWQYAVMAFALILVFFLMTLAGERGSVTGLQREDPTTELMTGDWSVKVALLFQGLKAQQFQRQASQGLEMGLVNYRKASEKGSPGGTRRYGVLAYELGRPDGTAVFERLTSRKVTRGLPKQDVVDLRSEAAMWRDIYSGTITPEMANGYAARIRALNLGPVRGYALAHLYRFAGQERPAAKAMSEARERAASSVIPGTLLLMLLFAAGFAGLVFIIIFLLKRTPPSRRPEPPAEESPSGEEVIEVPRPVGLRRPWVLFQAFTVYAGLLLVFSIAAGLAASPALQRLESEQRLLYTVVLEFGLSVVTGLIALVALQRILKVNGATPADIGLTTRELGRNILWGIGGYCALIPILVLAALISAVLFRGFKTPQHPIVPMLLSGDMAVFVILFVMGAVLAPFFEETFFRGVLYRGLRARMTFVGATVLSAVAFSIIHPQLPAGFLPIFAIGAVFAVLAETRQSLVPSMVAHALNNGVIFLMMYFFFIA